MLRRFLSIGVGALVLLVVLGAPGRLHAQRFRGGFRPGITPGFRGRFTPGFGRMPGFRTGFTPGFNREFFEPRFSPGLGPAFFRPF
jgi:hypothetical protein